MNGSTLCLGALDTIITLNPLSFNSSNNFLSLLVGLFVWLGTIVLSKSNNKQRIPFL